jgi:hypothetical protein
MWQTVGALLIGICVVPSFASAQDRPFVFSLTTTTDASVSQLRADYELGVGEHVFHQQTSNGPEQRFGIQASVGRITFVGHVGVASGRDTFQMSQQAETLVSLISPGASRLAVAGGGGILHEAGGTNVLLARVVAGYHGVSNQLNGNLVFQKPLASGRDAVDVITSLGWSARLTPLWSLGVEAVGEDLEGFWDAQEAEGGARLLVGPSIHLTPPAKRWQLSVAGGPVFHPTVSARASDAIRDLPPIAAARDFAIRTTFAYKF